MDMVISLIIFNSLSVCLDCIIDFKWLMSLCCVSNKDIIKDSDGNGCVCE